MRNTTFSPVIYGKRKLGYRHDFRTYIRECLLSSSSFFFFSNFSYTIYGLGQSLKEVGQVLSTTRKGDKT